MQITFTIDGIPVSYNKHFKIDHYNKQVYLTEEARRYKNYVAMCVPAVTFKPNVPVSFTGVVYGNWFTKKGTIRKIDVQNMDKLLVDAIFKKIGIDDKCVFDIRMSKVQHDSKECIVVTVKEMEVYRGEK